MCPLEALAGAAEWGDEHLDKMTIRYSVMKELKVISSYNSKIKAETV